jgi:hypothetical protein
MRRWVEVLFVTGLCFGQTGGEATLSGKIVDSLTHQPLGGAKVLYRSPGHDVSAISDADGGYSIHAVSRENSDLVEIALTGYATQRVMVRLKPGSSVARDFELSRAARISGHLFDRDSGKPISGLTVQAMQRIEDQEDPEGANFATAPSVSLATASDADGAFVVANLAPGDYTLQIRALTGGRITFGDKKPAEPGYGTTWFPGVPVREMATPVTVAAGENREIEVRLRKRELYRVGGVFQAPEGMEGDGIWIAVMGPTGVAESDLPKAGPFHVDGLAEGLYTILASTKTTPGHERVFASRRLELTDRSIDDLKLTMRPSVALRAVVTMAEENADIPGDIRFDPLPIDMWTLDSGGQNKSDRLRVTGLPPGEYWPALMTPPGYVVASVSYGGRPVPPMTPIDVEAPESSVTYVLTSRLARVTGTVRDADQKPVSNATVWLLPSSLPDTVGRLFFMGRGSGGRANSDGNGIFSVGGLAPGHYKAVALTGNDRHRNDPLFLRDLLPSAVEVVPEPGKTANVDLRVR